MDRAVSPLPRRGGRGRARLPWHGRTKRVPDRPPPVLSRGVSQAGAWSPSPTSTWYPCKLGREPVARRQPALTASVDAGVGGERWPPARSCRGRGHVHKERAESNRNGSPAGRGAMAPRGAPRWRAARRPREQPRGVHQREHHYKYVVLRDAFRRYFREAVRTVSIAFRYLDGI